MRRTQRSTGELISSVAFFGAALWLVFEARNLLDNEQNIKGILVYFGLILGLWGARWGGWGAGHIPRAKMGWGKTNIKCFKD